MKVSNNTRRRKWAVTFLLAAVVGAVAASSASAALPEFSNNSYPIPITVKSTGQVTIQSAEGAWLCESMTASGSVTGHKTGTVTFKISGCASGLPIYCHSGPLNNELETVPMSLTPVYTAGKQVALEFKPASGETVASLKGILGACTLKGSILARITHFSGAEFGLHFEQTGHGTQIPSQFETEKGELVNSWLEIGLNSSGKFTRESWETATILKSTPPYFLELRG
jgi:hypothetical protein